MESTKQPLDDSPASESDKNWLQKLKDESWEAELLVAAVGTFGSFQLFGFIDWLANLFINLLPRSLYFVGYFITFTGLAAVSILACMFVIHFMLRAYWVGLVGLNSVFSDYSTKDSMFSQSYTEKITRILPKLDQSVESADRLCSVIFAAAFCMLMMYTSMGLFGSLYLLAYHFLSRFVPEFILLIPLVVMVTLLVLQAIISAISNLPKYKENERIQHIYYRTALITSICTFGPLYKSVLQISMTFSSNFKRDAGLVKLVLLFVLSGFILAGAKMNQTNILYLFVPDKYFDATEADPRFYQDKNADTTFLLAPQLGSDVIKEPIIDLFIPIYRSERYHYKQQCQALIDVENGELSEKRLARLSCYKAFHQILIDGTPMEVDMIKALHPETGQFGIIAYIRMDDRFNTGQYQLEVVKSIHSTPLRWFLPFYYVSHD